MKWLARLLYAGFTLLLLALIAAWQLYNYLNTPIEMKQQSLVVQVKLGSSFSFLAGELEKQGLIEKPGWFAFYAHLANSAHRVQAGEYLIESPITPAELLLKLELGRVIQYRVTFPEGWNFRQMMVRLNALEKMDHRLIGLSAAEIMALLGRDGEHPEGRFFPDSYSFVSGSSDLDVLRRAYRKMEQLLEEEWQQRDPGLPYKDAYGALVMASIVEKETAVLREQPEIAGVFVRRLEAGMRLQTDPTVIYGLGESFKGNLTRRHLTSNTAYNTYIHNGLPPTPIAMPGRAAIHAVMHPASGATLYFVARGDGTHLFSDTLVEHQRAVRRFQIEKRSSHYRSTPLK